MLPFELAGFSGQLSPGASFCDLDDFRALLLRFAHRCRDPRRNCITRLSKRIIVNVGVTLGCPSLCVTEQFSNNREAMTVARADAGEAMAQIVDA